jgi:hypothetical protein
MPFIYYFQKMFFFIFAAYVKVGGLWALEYKYPRAIPDTYDPSTNSTCGLPRDDAFHILRDPVHSDLPWPGVVIRSTFVSLWYWCTDQVRARVLFFKVL